MRQKMLIHCAAAALAASLGTTAWAAQANGSAPQQGDRPSQPGNESSQSRATGSESAGQASADRGASKEHAGRRNGEAPEGFVIVEESTVYLMANEPQQHFLQAHADLARKDDRAAAEETRLAAAYLDMQAARHGDKQNNDLKQEAQRLRKVAGELEGQGNKGAGISVDQLDRDFARASDTLARHFDALSKWDLHKDRYVVAGYDLDATAGAFKNTIIWSNQKPSKEELTMIGNAQEIATHLRNQEVYQGEQALNSEKQGWNKDENKSGEQHGQQSAQALNNKEEPQAQQANAKLPAGVTHSPLTGTTPAEARNDAQHAQKLADALGQAIDQFGSKIDRSDAATGNDRGANPGNGEHQGQGANNGSGSAQRQSGGGGGGSR